MANYIVKGSLAANPDMDKWILDNCPMGITIACNAYHPDDNTQVLILEEAVPWRPDLLPRSLKHLLYGGIRKEAIEIQNYCEKAELHAEPFVCGVEGLPCPTSHAFWPMGLQNKLGCRPLTGILALYKTLEVDPDDKIYMTGFNFYRRPDGSYPAHVGPHRIEPHIRWLRDLLKRDKRIVIDPILEKVLKEYKPPLNDCCKVYRDLLNEAMPHLPKGLRRRIRGVQA